MKQRALGSVAVAVSLWCLPYGAAAFTRGESNWDPLALPIVYKINLASAPASIGMDGARAAVEAGFASWAAPTCTRWRATNGGTTTLTRARAGDSERSILWISDSWPPELGDVRSTIGVTTPVWRRGGYFIDADIQFNAVGFRWNNTGINGVDTQSIATHEEGHFLGLNHSPVGRAVMYASYSGGIKRTLDSDDVNGVCAIYPAEGTVPPPDAGTGDAGSGSGTGAVGDVCNAGRPCSTGLRCVCRSSADCFCTRSCGPTSPCPPNFVCANTNLGALCVPGGSTMTGTGRTGEPCTSGADCASGICVRGGTRTFCSQVCTDDCSCPADYHCVATTTPGTNVCAPGGNECLPADKDGGLTEVDAGSPSAEQDASTTIPDATPSDASRDGGMNGRQPGCGCRVPARASHENQGALSSVALAGVFASLWRNRRRKKKPATD